MNSDIWAATGVPAFDAPAGDVKRSPLLDAKVMMVDDEPLMTDLIQAYLEDEGYTNFVVTNDPREALELLRQEDPGVLLLDLMMPQMSGFELLEAIRADRALRYTPVIVLTASTGAESKLRALKLGATDFLAKPVDASELVLRVRNTLAFRQYHNRLINFDPVTGFPNHRLFDRGIDDMIAVRDLCGGMVAVFSISVPVCREIRESIDQATADDLARVLANRLNRFATAENFKSPFATSNEKAPRVARLSDEQFGLVLEGVADADALTFWRPACLVFYANRSHSGYMKWVRLPGSASRCALPMATPPQHCARAQIWLPPTPACGGRSKACLRRQNSMQGRCNA